MQMRKKEPLTLSLCTIRDVFAGGQALGDVEGARYWKARSVCFGESVLVRRSKGLLSFLVLFSQSTYTIFDDGDFVLLIVITLVPSTYQMCAGAMDKGIRKRMTNIKQKARNLPKHQLIQINT